MSKSANGEKTKASSAFHIIAGLGSGATSAVILQPADLLKTRIQQSQAASLRVALKEILGKPHPVKTLWRGVVPSVLRTGCGSALYFGMLNQMRQYAATRIPLSPTSSLPTRIETQPKLGSNKSPTSSHSHSSSALPRLSNIANLTTGALARVSAGLIVNPITVLKVRYESSHYSYTSLSHAFRDILHREGPRGFFAGFGATAARDAPYAGLYVLVYEQAKQHLSTFFPTPTSSSSLNSSASSNGKTERSNGRSASGSASINFLSGVLAAVTATTLTNPFDAIKTRLQLAPAKYGNLLIAAKLMLRDEGVRSMFSGLSMRIGRKALSSAFTWTVYEELIRRAEKALPL